MASQPESSRPSATYSTLETQTGTLALEILNDTGLVIDDRDPIQSSTVEPVNNLCGEDVRLSAGSAIGQVAIVIPAGESRAIKTTPGRPLQTEFVEYEEYNSCFPGPAQPGVLCITQIYRIVIVDASARPRQADDPPGIVLYKTQSGGFGLVR